MSEQTGATDAQIEAAAERRYNFLMTGYPNRTHMTGMGKTWDIDAKRKRLITSMTVHARYLVPPGYRIVPADAVVVTPEIAATAAEACEGMAERDEDELAENEWSYAPKLTATIRNGIAANRAAAAALRGEG